ncbi:hypothetical protein EB796_014460 [Bugula neritina]|uniref:Uncharacterized protein n=1 Tax=Bugula neritina TaxID=10212 RepID=A0A7J7JNM4_BUGNE|nr:hypothetical protein EB796_014460 [Bugula neritina]
MENSGRKATVTMTMPKVDGSSMGLYQPRAYLRGSEASSSGYVALSPLVDLKVDEVDDSEPISGKTSVTLTSTSCLHFCS